MANVRLRDLNPAKFLNDLEVDNAVRINTSSSESAQLKVEADSGNSYAALFKKGTASYWFADGTMYFNSVNGMYMVNQSSYLRLGANNAEIIRIQSGKVGIGTGSVVPTEILTLNSSSNTRMVVQEAGADKGSIGAGGSGLYIRNLAGAILFRNIADATNMKIFDNGHITFGSNNNVGGQNHTFNPSTSYNQAYCSIAMHVPSNAADRKNWAISSSALGGAGSSYLKFSPLDDLGGAYGEAMFYMDHAGSDFSMRSKTAFSCSLQLTSPLGHAKLHLDSHAGSAGGSRFTIANDPVVNLFSIYRTPQGGSGEQGTPNISLRSANAPPDSSTAGYPGGAGIGTYNLSGGGETWNNNARMLKVQSDAGVGSGAAAGIVLYNADNGNHDKSWAMYTYGTGTSSRLSIQYGDEVARYTRMDAYGTWAYRGGVQQSAFWDYNSTTNNGTTVKYLHLKTNVKKSNSYMFHIVFEGYAYAIGEIIDSACAGSMDGGWDNSANPGNPKIMNNNGTSTIHIDSMYATSPSDGEYLVIVLKMPNYTQYYCGIIARANMANPAGRGVIVTALDNSLTTSTAEVW